MKKSATLVTTALLAFGFAAASMAAADMPKSAAPMAADTASPPATKTHKHTSKKHKKAAPAPATTK
jgi:hypothetical protein